MNKELINKYKPEFDYFLNEGKILYKHIHSNAWWNEDPWNYSPSYITAIIINDEYSIYRKALAEGKIVEVATDYNDADGYIWKSMEDEEFQYFNIDEIRIKPEEPQSTLKGL